jgi:surface antigen
MMRPRANMAMLAAGIATSMLLGALVVLAPEHLQAREPQFAASVTVQPLLDVRDELSTFEAIGTALSEVEDHSIYVWHSDSGRIGGIVELTSSFRDRRGLVCRHLVLTLSAGEHARRMEGIACRDKSGSWSLDG